MKTSYYSRIIRQKSSLLFSFALLALLAITTSSRATTTYSYTGSHSLVWTSNSDKYVPIFRTGGTDSLTVDAELLGSSNFSLNTGAVFWPDSANDSDGRYDSVRYFFVSFSSQFHDTSYATLVLWDGNHSDSIQLTGIGTLDTIDFNLESNEWDFTYFSDSGVTGVSSQIRNHRSSGISVTVTLSDSTYWKVDSVNSITIPLLGNGTANVLISYTPHGVWQDSVLVYFTCTSPYYQQWSSMVRVTDPDFAPYRFEPTIIGPNLGVVGNGDTACGTATIRNSTPELLTISSLTFSACNGLGSWTHSGEPSTPFSLAIGDSITFTVCFTPDNNYSGYQECYGITAAYSDSSGYSGSITGSATAQTAPCLQLLDDTVHLDELIMGGYVDASARFICHEDSVIRGVTGEVLPIGGSVQILSPSLPYSVHAGDTVTFQFRVTPDGRADSGASFYNYYGYYLLQLGDCESEIQFVGSEIDTNTALQLFGNETGLLALQSTRDTTVDTFWFDNNNSNQVIVSNVALTQGTNFQILGEIPHSPADTLASGTEMGVIIQFDGDTNGFYHDSLTVTTDASRTKGKTEITSGTTKTLVFNLEAIRSQSSESVSETLPVSSADVSIVPNPSNGPVEISVRGAARATIEIYDLLGKQITATIDGTLYEWNAENLPNGVFIARVSGVDTNGLPFVISKRISLQR